MKFLDKLRGIKSSTQYNDVSTNRVIPMSDSGFSLSGVIKSLFAGQTVNYNTAMRQADVYTCVKILAESFGQIPTKVYHTTGYGENKRTRRVDHGREYDIFCVRPNEYMTWQELFEMYMATIQLRGNFYAEIKRNTLGEVYSIVPLKYQGGVSVWYDINGLPTYCYTTNDGKGHQVKNYYTNRDLLHIKSFTLDGLTGLSTISQAASEIGLAIAQNDSASSLFANGAQPSGVLTTNNVFENRKLIDEIRNRWAQDHAGTANTGKIAVLENGMEYRSIQMTSTDAQLLETMQLSRERISAMFRVPLHMLNSKDGMRYNSVDNNNIAFFRDALSPHVIKWENALNSLCRKGYRIVMDENQFIRGDVATMTDIVQKQMGMGLRDMNEGRVALGLDPRDGMDGIFAIDTNNLTFGTMDDLVKLRELTFAAMQADLDSKRILTTSNEEGVDNDSE